MRTRPFYDLPFMSSREDARYFIPLVAGLAALAWAALFWLDRTGVGPHLHCHDTTLLTVLGARADENRLNWGFFFLAGWTLMTVAMMFPTILKFVGIFRRLTLGRADQGVLLSLLLSGYLSVWVVFGLAVFGVSNAASQLMAPFLTSRENGRLLATAFFLIAGAFQFLPFKYHCLDRCRSPLSCVAEHWGVQQPRWNSFRLGLRHGVFCVGCCWALMLLMFAAGSAHLVWMLLLAIVMAVEKNLPWGRRLAKPLGAFLLLGAAVIFFFSGQSSV
jgi:predicted metal-binding membrane protein